MLAALFVPFFASCDDDDEASGNNADPDTDSAEMRVLPLTFDRFLSAGDVLVASDSSYITVSKYYLQTIGQDICDSDRVVVWRAAEELPFAKKVTGVSDAGSNRIKIDLAYVDFTEVIPEGDYDFSSDLYYNPDEQPRTNDGGFNDDHYVEEESTTGTSIYHPVAIIRDPYETTNEDGVEHIMSDIDDLPCVLVEEMSKSNWELNKKKLINLTTSFEKIYIPGLKDGNTEYQIGFSKIEASVNAGFYLKLNTGIKRWFKPYVKEFKATVNGGVGLKGEFVARVSGTIKPKEKMEETLGTLTCFKSVYMIGPIPVVVTSTPKIIAEFSPKIEGRFGQSVSFELSASAEAGAQYLNDSGWSGIWEPKTKCEIGTPKIDDIYGAVSASVGIYLKADVKLYSVAGPVVKFGPSVKASASGEYDFVTGQGSAKASIKAQLGGSIGAELKIWKWKLADWSTSFTLAEWDLWSASYPGKN